MKLKNLKETPFTYQGWLSRCFSLVVFKAPKTSSKAESVSQVTKPGAKSRHKKLSTSSKQPSMSSKEETKGRSSKAPTSSKPGHSKKIKESQPAMDSNPIHPPVSTPHASFIIHTESASGNGASAASIAEADLRKSAPSTDPNVLADKTNLKKKLQQIKLEDLAKLVSKVHPSFKDLNSLEDDPVIVVDDIDEDEEDVHTTTKDTSVPKSSSPKSYQIQELTNQLNELLVKSITAEFSKILFAHDFRSSLPSELKDLPSKLNELTKEVKGLKFRFCSSKAGDQGVPSAGQDDTPRVKQSL
ncbi:hypothetical protein Tco_0174547 [Tanacetum coccineum]